MTTTAFPIQQPAGLVTHDLEGHDNIYAKEPQMTMVGFLAALVTELATGEGLLNLIGLQ